MRISKKHLFAFALLLFTCQPNFVLAAPDEKKETPANPSSPMLFDSPQAAMDALVKAAATDDEAALIQILGPDGKDLVTTEDPVADKNRAEDFAAKAKVKTSIEPDP